MTTEPKITAQERIDNINNNFDKIETLPDAIYLLRQARYVIEEQEREIAELKSELEGSEKMYQGALSLCVSKEEENKKLKEFLTHFVGAEDAECDFDHNGSCQEHNCFGDDFTCITKDARDLLKLNT